VTGGWGKLHKEEFHNLYSSPSIIRIIKSRRMRWAGHVARMGEKMNVDRLLVGKPEGKRPLERPRRRWIDNIKMDLLEIGLGVVAVDSHCLHHCQRLSTVPQRERRHYASGRTVPVRSSVTLHGAARGLTCVAVLQLCPGRTFQSACSLV
jgi:hypothetical protein